MYTTDQIEKAPQAETGSLFGVLRARVFQRRRASQQADPTPVPEQGKKRRAPVKLAALMVLVAVTMILGSIITGIAAVRAPDDLVFKYVNGLLSGIILIAAILIALEVHRLGLRKLSKLIKSRTDNEHGQIFSRFLIGFLCLAYITVKGADDGISADGVQASIAVIGFLCGYGSTLFWLMIRNPAPSHPRRIAAVLSDFASTTIALHLGGEYSAPFYGVYLWVVLGNGFRYGIPYLYFAAAAGTFGFGIVIAFTPFWVKYPGLSIGLLATLVIIPVFVGSLIKRLHEAKAEAEAASKAKSRFVAAMSHELRTPLTAIIGISDLLAGTRIDGDQRSMTRGVKSAANTLLSLINNILDISKFEAGQMTPSKAPLNLYQLIAELDHMFALQARHKGLEFRVSIDPATPAWIETDSHYLRDAIINLIGNAMKFTSQGHIALHVAVEQDRQDRWLKVSVSDTGVGIPADKIGSIFGTFTQADESVTRRFGGSGLGLSIVKLIAQALGGDIEVESVPDEGSTFLVTVPLETPGSVPAANETPANLDIWLVSRSDAFKDQVRTVSESLPAQPLVMTSIATLTEKLNSRSSNAAPVLALIDCAPESGAEDLEALNSFNPEPGAFGSILVNGTEECFRAISSGSGRGLARVDIEEAGALDRALNFARYVLSDDDQEDGRAVFAKRDRSFNILVVEDNTVNRKVVGRILSNAGHVPTLACDGYEALEALEQSTFDIVLMDFNMPEMTGADVVKMYRFANPSDERTPFVAFTADGTLESRKRCEAAGMVGLVVKPIEAARLLAEVDRYAVPAHNTAAADNQSTPQQAEPTDTELNQPAVALDLADDAEEAAEKTATNIVAHPSLEGQSLIIDESAIEQLRAISDDAKFFEALVLDFLRDSQETLERLREGVADCDAAVVRDEAHAMRSSASHFGAQKLFKLCLKVSHVEEAELRKMGVSFLQEVEDTVSEMEGKLMGLLDGNASKDRGADNPAAASR